jgi:hypothetical protein
VLSGLLLKKILAVTSVAAMISACEGVLLTKRPWCKQYMNYASHRCLRLSLEPLAFGSMHGLLAIIAMISGYEANIGQALAVIVHST